MNLHSALLLTSDLSELGYKELYVCRNKDGSYRIVSEHMFTEELLGKGNVKIENGEMIHLGI